MARAVDNGTIALALGVIAVLAGLMVLILTPLGRRLDRRRARRVAGPAPEPANALKIAQARRVLRTLPVLDPVDPQNLISWGAVATRFNELRAAAEMLDQAYRAALAARMARGCQCATCVRHRFDGWLP